MGKHLKEHVNEVSPRTIDISWQDFQQLLQRLMSTSYDVLERMLGGALPLKTYCNYNVPMVLSFDSLCHLQ